MFYGLSLTYFKEDSELLEILGVISHMDAAQQQAFVCEFTLSFAERNTPKLCQDYFVEDILLLTQKIFRDISQ